MDGPLPATEPGGPPAQQFRGVHCIKESHDGLLYVCDRPNNRFQVFQKDGTFIAEAIVPGAAISDVAFSADPEQRFVYASDGQNRRILILRRDTLETVGSFGNRGYYAGEFAGYLHALASDSKGNVYVGEHQGGNRIQRFKVTGSQGE
jgi:sugar lactone lactonase YvrE